MATDILNIATVAAAQNQKEVTINDAIRALENAGNEVLVVDVDDTNAVTLTDAQWRGAGTFVLAPDGSAPPDATITVTVPTIKRHAIIVNTTAQAADVEISGQTEDAVSVPAGSSVVVVSDASDLRSAGGGSSGGASAWTGLTDTPSSYSGQGGKVPKVNVGETALEFGTVASAEIAIVTDATTARTLALSDAASHVRMTSGSANTVTVPPNSSVAFPTGTQIWVVQAGAGATTIAAGSGVTVNNAGSLDVGGQGKAVKLVKIATDEWDLLVDEVGTGSGASAWTGLSDTPSSLSGQAGRVPKVNSGESALEFGDFAPASLTVTDDTGTSRTLALTDAGTYVRMDNGSANTVTVPPNSSVAFPAGTQVHVRQVGAGQTTIAAGSGVTINTPETLKLRAQHSTATLVKVATDEWDVMGDLEAA